MDKLHQIEKEIERAVESYKKAVREIQTSKDPIYQSPEKQEYEISKLREQLDANVAELKAKYQAEADVLIEEAERSAALSVTATSDSDKSIVNQRLDEFTADVTLAYSKDDKLAAYDRLIESLKYFDLPKLLYLRRSLSDVIARIGDDETVLRKLREMNAELQKINTAEQDRLNELRELKRAGGDIAYRNFKIIETRKYGDITSGGHDVETYLRRQERV